MSRLAQMQAKFQQKQMHEKEEKLLRLYENQQQRAFERVGRGSAGSNSNLITLSGGGKVRQMFDERRQKAGIDKSYPLEPIKPSKSSTRTGSMDRIKNNPTSTSRTIVKSTVQKSVSQIRNGKPLVNKREVVQSIYNNNDGDETYEEHRFEDDNVENVFTNNSHKEMIDMFNQHNLNDNSNEYLDNEHLPQIGFDEVDEPYLKGKLANVGGKLPSQNNLSKSFVETTKTATITNTPLKRNTKPTVRKFPVTPTQTRTVTSPATSSPSPRNNSTPSTPTKTNMSSANTTTKRPTRIASGNKPGNINPKASIKSTVLRDDLSECKFCGRRFATDRLQVHENICSKTGKKKRKTYDATKHRVAGTELETFVGKGGKMKLSAPKSNKVTTNKSDWRTTHEEFIAAIRSAKMAQAHLAKGGKLSDLPPPPPSSNPDYVQCPHCGRRFNEAAAQRHIPKCATFLHNKPKQSVNGTGRPKPLGRK